MSSDSITHLFFAKKTWKVPPCEKDKSHRRSRIPQDCWNYGTLLLCQLTGLCQSIGSTRTYPKRKTANKSERLRITCYDCRSSLYFYQHECKDTYYPYHYPVFIISIGFTCQHFLSLSVVICCCLSLWDHYVLFSLY